MANLDTPIYGAIGISFCTEIQLSNRYLTHHLYLVFKISKLIMVKMPYWGPSMAQALKKSVQLGF